MGEVEHLMAEPEEGEVEDIEGAHPTNLAQQNPWLITQVFTTVTTLIAAYGWHVIGFSVLGYVVWIRMKPKYSSWQKKRDDDKEAAEIHKDPDKFIARERAIDAARLRMQEQYNKSAQDWSLKQKEQEEKRRQERIKEWEHHERGEGYYSKSRMNQPAASAANGSTSVASTSASSSGSAEKKSGKPKLRPEYNPMTGDVGGGSCRWRPERRGGASGGG